MKIITMEHTPVLFLTEHHTIRAYWGVEV
jgi:hypothetical protein